MNLPHLHILLNHFPTVGFSIAVLLFFAALTNKSEDLKRASLAIIFFIAVLVTAVYTSGSAAERAMCQGAACLPGVNKPAIYDHESAAFLAFMLMQVTGILAFVGLWQLRRDKRLGSPTAIGILLCSAVTFALMARAAAIGGEIRHPEIIEAASTAAAPAEGGAGGAPKAATETASEGAPKPEEASESAKKVAETPIAETPVTEKTETNEAAAAEVPNGTGTRFELPYLNPASIRRLNIDTRWVWPASETLHFIGLSLLMGVVLIVDLRILGLAKAIPFSSLHRMLPWALLGFGINLITGMYFFIATPDQYTENHMFFYKVLLIVLAGANAMYFLFFDQVWNVRSDENAPLVSKMFAVSAIALWIGVLFCGHMLPFLGNAF